MLPRVAREYGQVSCARVISPRRLRTQLRRVQVELGGETEPAGLERADADPGGDV